MSEQKHLTYSGNSEVVQWLKFGVMRMEIEKVHWLEWLGPEGSCVLLYMRGSQKALNREVSLENVCVLKTVIDVWKWMGREWGWRQGRPIRGCSNIPRERWWGPQPGKWLWMGEGSASLGFHPVVIPFPTITLNSVCRARADKKGKCYHLR